MTQRLLLNWAYYNPVGHLFEALQHAYGYYVANRATIDVYLVVNAASPLELVRACPWVAGVYPLAFDEIEASGEAAPSLRAIPSTWEFIISDPRVQLTRLKPGWDEPDLIAAQTLLQSYLHATVWNGWSRGWECRWNTQGLIGRDDPLLYQANARFQLPIPAAAQQHVMHYQHEGPTVCVIPGGSSGLAQSPSLHSWAAILDAFAQTLPGLRIQLTGVSQSSAGRTHTADFTLDAIDWLTQQFPFVRNCFDIGLWNQVALIAASDVLCAPHTGFAFLSQFVGTPWLALSGCPWPEYVFNGTPFYSVIPDCASYPAEGDPARECTQLLARGEKAVCMQDGRIEQRLPDMLRGLRLLMQETFTYEEAIQVHKANLLRQQRDQRQFGFFFDDGQVQ